MGLSPLARGNRLRLRQGAALDGPIPARAGQPGQAWESGRPIAAYPRSRGATSRSAQTGVDISGLSPLARGNPRLARVGVPFVRPIPARAGQPLAAAPPPVQSRAYPRSRGATACVARRTGFPSGLSPLARGNRSENALGKTLCRPIPARAGQPCRRRTSRRYPRAYPRSRGATGRPRGWRSSRGGPIPARAGQPRPCPRPRPSTRAYPRSRGATKAGLKDEPLREGLSPLARGNPFCPWPRPRPHGPIPARAGQPAPGSADMPAARAYPRSRGATSVTTGSSW